MVRINSKSGHYIFIIHNNFFSVLTAKHSFNVVVLYGEELDREIKIDNMNDIYYGKFLDKLRNM